MSCVGRLALVFSYNTRLELRPIALSIGRYELGCLPSGALASLFDFVLSASRRQLFAEALQSLDARESVDQLAERFKVDFATFSSRSECAFAGVFNLATVVFYRSGER